MATYWATLAARAVHGSLFRWNGVGRIGWAVCLLVAGVAVAPAMAQASLTARDNYDPFIRDRSTIATIDQNTVFGDSTDINSGVTNFYVTVASVPGNNQLEVALRYRYVQDRAFPGTWHWERDDPYLVGDFIQSEGWVLGNVSLPNSFRSTARCTGTNLATGAFTPPAVNVSSDGQPGYWYPYEYYNGIHLVLPRGRGAAMIPGGTPAATPPSQGGPYPWVTNDGWFFSCIPLKNGDGEGFLGLAPDGTKYYFDDLEPGPELLSISKRNVGGKDIQLYRQEFRLYASRIEDRFGNYVEGLSASDGRGITATDVGNGVLQVDAGTQEWMVATQEPFTITNPDGSKWKLAGNWSGIGWGGGGGDPGDYCSPARPYPDFSGSATVTVTIPSGATALFNFAPIQRGLSHVPLSCRRPEGALDNGMYFINPSLVTEIALSKKAVSGPGMAPHWTVATYGPPNDCFDDGDSMMAAACGASSPTTVTTKLTRSDGTYTTYTFGNQSYVNQGQLLKTEDGFGSEAPIKVVNQQWQLFDPLADGYASLSSTSASLSVLKRMVVKRRDVIQQDRAFTWQIVASCGAGSELCVDQFIRPTKFIKSSAPAP